MTGPLRSGSLHPCEEREHSGRRYAVQFTYALPDDAWCVELSEARSVSVTGADIENAAKYLSLAARSSSRWFPTRTRGPSRAFTSTATTSM